MDYGRVVSAQALEEEYGFLLSRAIPVDRNGDVARIAVFKELNPFAPEQIFCDRRVIDAAEALAEWRRAVPVFIRLEPNRWADCGLWRATSLDKGRAATSYASEITGRLSRRTHGPIWGILHLELCEDPEGI